MKAGYALGAILFSLVAVIAIWPTSGHFRAFDVALGTIFAVISLLFLIEFAKER